MIRTRDRYRHLDRSFQHIERIESQNDYPWESPTQSESQNFRRLVLETGALLVARRDPGQGRLLVDWIERHVLRAFEGRIIPVDLPIARWGAALHVPNPRPVNDTLIAATALSHRLSVVTRNVRDFDGIQVTVVNPWDWPT